MKRKFTLIELLVVVVIIGILARLLLPSLSKSREKAKRAVCLSNTSQVLRAIHIYGSDGDNRIPHDYREYGGSNWMSTMTEPGNPSHGKYARLGRLLKDNLLNLEVLYCPSNVVPEEISWQWSFKENEELWEVSKDQTQNGVYLCANYMYRKGLNAPSRLTDDASEPIISDLFFTLNSKEMQQFFHIEGWNVGYLDGSAKFVYRTNVYAAPNQNDAPQWDEGFFKN